MYRSVNPAKVTNSSLKGRHVALPRQKRHRPFHLAFGRRTGPRYVDISHGAKASKGRGEGTGAGVYGNRPGCGSFLEGVAWIGQGEGPRYRAGPFDDLLDLLGVRNL